MPTVAQTTAELAEESRRLNNLIRGKAVKRTKRFRPSELLIEFEDGTRLFVNAVDGGLELSVTEGVAQ